MRTSWTSYLIGRAFAFGAVLGLVALLPARPALETAMGASGDADAPRAPLVRELPRNTSAYEDRILALLGEYEPSHDDDAEDDEAWALLVREREAAYSWCAEHVATEQNVSIAAAYEILGAAATSFEPQSVETVLSSLERVASDDVNAVRVRQCAALLRLADPATQ